MTATLGDIHMAFSWRCTKWCKGVDFNLWSVGSYVHFVPFFPWVRVFTKAFCLEFVRIGTIRRKKDVVLFIIFSHCWLFGPICQVLQASSAARSFWTNTTKVQGTLTSIPTHSTPSCYVASTMWASSRNVNINPDPQHPIMLRSINHVSKFKER